MIETSNPGDVRVYTDSNNGNNGTLGNNGFIDLIALLIIVGMFGGGMWGGGFGGGGQMMWWPWFMQSMGGTAPGSYGQFATAASQQEILFGQQFQGLDNKIDRIANGIADLGYANAQLINGVQMQNANNTAALQSTLCQGFSGINTNLQAQGYETRIGINGIGQQMAQCCCDIREGIAGVNYNMATQANNLNYNLATQGNAIQRQISDTGCETQRQIERGFCDVGYGMNTNTTAIMQNAHNDADRILARIDKMESDRQQERIAQLTADNTALKFHVSQQEQNAYLVSQLGYQCPKPAYVVQPPQQVTFPTNCCGQASYAANGGCGCGNY